MCKPNLVSLDNETREVFPPLTICITFFLTPFADSANIGFISYFSHVCV